MTVNVACTNPECRHMYSVAESKLGKKATCRHCGQQFTLGGEARDTAGDVQPRDTGVLPPAGSASRLPSRLGRFLVRSPLGAGAFGAVYRAHDPTLDREVALKVPHPGSLDSQKARDRFLREPKAAAQLRHPNIVPVYDAGVDGDTYYIASAFIEGQTLKDAIEDGGFAHRKSVTIVRALAEALDYAHRRKVVHRDVKPANILLDSEGSPLLMDFGLARLLRAQANNWAASVRTVGSGESIKSRYKADCCRSAKSSVRNSSLSYAGCSTCRSHSEVSAAT